MKLKEIVEHIQLALNKSSIKDDNRIDNRQVAHLVHIYRARDIRDTYKRDNFLDPTWIQNMGVCLTTKVNSSDDASFSCGTTKLGKVSIPTLLSLPGDAGLVKISNCANTKDVRILPKNRFDTTIRSIDESSDDNLCGLGASVMSNGQYATRYGNTIVTYPLMKEVSLNLILDNPMDGYVMNDTLIKKDAIKYDVEYKVDKGSVRYNGTSYSTGSTFIGIQNINTYSGSGDLKVNGDKRKLNEDDEYPVSGTQVVQIIMRILTEYFKVEAGSIADTINDAKDETRKVSDVRGNR